MRAKPRLIGRNRKGKWKWVVFSRLRTAEFSVWAEALDYANRVSPRT